MIAVVGGGLTGLALGHALARRGVAHTIFEAAERPGGVIRSERVQGHLLEWGPQRTRLVGPLRQLVKELDIEKEIITAPPGLPLFVYRKGRLRRVPFSVSEFLRTDLFTLGGKARLLAEPFTAGATSDERVATFFTRKFGREAYENLLGPLYGGLYASDPADMVVGQSLGHVLREFGVSGSLLMRVIRRGGKIAAPEACSFREGLQTLTNALWAANRPNIRLGTPVARVSRDGQGWRVELADGMVEASNVVLTTDATATAMMLRTLAPRAAERIGSLHYNPLAVVHLHSDARLEGLGYQVSLAETLTTRGVTWNDSLFDHRGVYTAYLGGAKTPGIAATTDSEVAEIAIREFEEVTGHTAEALQVVRTRMPAWDYSWGAIDGLELPEGITLAANWQARPGIPGRLAQAERVAAELAGP